MDRSSSYQSDEDNDDDEVLENISELSDAELLLDVEDLGNVLAGAKKAKVCVSSFFERWCRMSDTVGCFLWAVINKVSQETVSIGWFGFS